MIGQWMSAEHLMHGKQVVSQSYRGLCKTPGSELMQCQYTLALIHLKPGQIATLPQV